MIDKNTPKPVFSRDEHYQKRQSPQRMVYHAASGTAGRNGPVKRVNYHAGAAGVYTRKTTSRMNFSSSSSPQGAASGGWRSESAVSRRSEASSWRTESSESLRRAAASKAPTWNASRPFFDELPQAGAASRPVRQQTARNSRTPGWDPPLQGVAQSRVPAGPQTGQRANRTRPAASSRVEQEQDLRVPWFTSSNTSAHESTVPVSTETVLEPIKSSSRTGNTVLFPTVHENEDQQSSAQTQHTARRRQPESKRGERHKAPAKKKKRKSVWKRWKQAREEKKRSAPPKTPEQMKRIRTMKKVGAVAFATLAVLICAFVTSFYLFKIETITVVQPEGGTAYEDGQIVQAFGTPLGDNLFGYSAQKVQANMVAALPYLESVSIKRVLPNQVRIEVAPAVETYQIESAQGGWAVLSATQKVLRLAQQAQDGGLITIRGTKVSQPVPGAPAAFEAPDKQEMFTQIMNQVNAKGLTPVNEVDLTDPLEMNLLYAGRIRIVLGTINDIAYKVDWAWRLVTPQLEESLKETATGILDVSTRTEEGRGKASYLAGSTEIVHDVQQPAQETTQEITDPQAVSEPAAQT